jgi:hypothetical protein
MDAAMSSGVAFLDEGAAAAAATNAEYGRGIGIFFGSGEAAAVAAGTASFASDEDIIKID